MRRLVIVCIALGVVALGASGAAAGGAGDDDEGGDDLTVVNFNVLHGQFCSEESDHCQLPDRMDLLGQRLEAAQCPDVVGLQEVSTRVYREIRRQPVIEACDYDIVLPRPKGIDQELVLTTLKVKRTKVVKLVGNFRTASRVVLESDLGRVVLVVTHQDGDRAPGEPGADAACTERACPPACEVGSPFLGCQTTVAADLADDAGGKKAIRILMGDFNVTSDSARMQGLVADGWVDTHLAAGNPECDPSGAGCTSGRRDEVVDDMKDPNARQLRRIDFTFVKPPARCAPVFDPDTDNDGDGIGTGIWDDAVTDGPGGMVFVSDHSATSVDLSCETSGGA
ncbi:MAG TPA: endonuclease/exonuclease/phosphatase family protein [Acidimicrobiia bacterium]|nr:endonuclease/exonuclease/phosphatase family protein [Acidimicrobiia bacterium]